MLHAEAGKVENDDLLVQQRAALGRLELFENVEVFECLRGWVCEVQALRRDKTDILRRGVLKTSTNRETHVCYEQEVCG